MLKLKASRNNKEQAQTAIRQKTAQEWLPVNDIRNSILQLKGQRIVAVLKVEPINISLLSSNEKKRIITSLYEVINGLQESFQWLSIGRPVDLDGYIAGLEYKATEMQDITRKILLKGYIKQAAEMAAGGETLERQFYIIMAAKQGNYAEEELLNKVRDMAANIVSTGLSVELCSDKRILDLLFTFMVPAQSAFERAPEHIGPYMPPIAR